MPLKAVLLIFSLCVLLTGCAVLNIPEDIKQPVLMPMAPPAGPSRRVLQQITALWPDRKETLLCVLELDKQRVAMAGLTNDGVSLFNLTYDGKTIVLDKSPLLPASVAPEFIITDLQLVYWPVTVLQKSMQASSWRLEVDKSHRRLYYLGNKMVEVNYLSPDAVWAKSVELINYRYNYHLQIKTISYEALSE
ncbi:MAG: DUF3261 domain-containing protein [Methylococcales bacterium]|nr:DUF3261 domain-containing protein [Methylococcales bacterium]